MADKVISAVKSTMNYEKFKKLKANRAVIQRRKDKLIESFKIRSVMNPIVVNQYYEIIDGQGRFEARKELGLPIEYVMEPNATIEDCSLMNAYNTPWTLSDFINEYVESGNENYVRLKSVLTEWKLPVIIALRYGNVSGRGGDTGGAKKLIMSGKLLFTPEQEQLCRIVATHCKELTDALMLQKRPSQAFQNAVKVAMDTEGYEPGRMIHNCKFCRSDFAVMSNLEAQLKEFSRVYNYRSKIGKLFFEDYMRKRGYNVRSYDGIGEAFRLDQTDVSTLKEKETK